ncbi:MAG: VOC family protein [Anaerolineales bacterium]|nr:VOC family protein [Anaerolineales bacterium]
MKHPPITQQVTFLYTRNLQASIHFYEEKLGLALVFDQGKCRIYRVSRDGYLGLCQRDDAPQAPDGVIFTLVTPDVDRWYQYVQAQEVAFEQAPTFNPDYDIFYHCFLRDPNGYLLEIQQFFDPAWPGDS